VGERAPKSIKLPDNQYVAGTDERERFDQARSVVLRAGRVVLEQLSSIDASGQQGIALQVGALPIGVRRHAHVANQHERITIKKRFPYAPTKRQGFPSIFSVRKGDFSALPEGRPETIGKQVFSDSRRHNGFAPDGGSWGDCSDYPGLARSGGTEAILKSRTKIGG
jgi:hypothetical protein